jgi:hypothetical protein
MSGVGPDRWTNSGSMLRRILRGSVWMIFSGICWPACESVASRLERI